MCTTARIATHVTPLARVADKPCDAAVLRAAALCFVILLARGVIACPKKL